MQPQQIWCFHASHTHTGVSHMSTCMTGQHGWLPPVAWQISLQRCLWCCSTLTWVCNKESVGVCVCERLYNHFLCSFGVCEYTDIFFLSHTLIRMITLACNWKTGIKKKKHPRKKSLWSSLSVFLTMPVLLPLSYVSHSTFLSWVSIIHQEYAYFSGFVQYTRDVLHMYSIEVPVLLLREALKRKTCWVSPSSYTSAGLMRRRQPPGTREERNGQ